METINRIENNCISDDSTLMEALNRLENARPKVLFVVDKDGRLKASLTDGDIRRAILSGIKLDAAITEFASHTPEYLEVGEHEGYLASKALELMRRYEISAVPVIKDDGTIDRIFTNKLARKSEESKIDIPVVIMAGGKGTRLYPYTKILPKPLIPIEDIPISERIIQSFCDAGCSEFHMIVNYRKDMIKAYFADTDNDYHVIFHDEDKPLGTGGGLKLIENDISETFILTNCDIMIMDDLADIVKHHRDVGNKATMVCSLKNFEIPYGIVNMTDKGDIESFEEKPTLSFFTNTGYYVLERDVFEYIKENEAIGMPDIIERMKANGLKVGVYPIGEHTWLDMGQFDSMASMEAFLRENCIDN